MKATIPPNWDPNNPQALKKWMEKLPDVYSQKHLDLEKMYKTDRKYQNNKWILT